MDTPSASKKAMPNLQRFLDESELAYRGVRFDIRSCQIKAKNGQNKKHEALIHPGAVVVLPLTSAHSVILIRNYRFSLSEAIWELPAGTLEPDEAPDKTALRELREETGYNAKILIPLTEIYSSPGISNEILYAYAAKDLSFAGQQLDDTEVITTHEFTWPEILKMVQTGEIRDNKTITTLLFYYTFLGIG